MREKLTDEEIIELYGLVTGNVTAQFELWLTITFAVIIASYLAGHRLHKILQFAIAILYSAVSVLLYLMIMGTVQFAERFDMFTPGNSDSGDLVVAIGLLRTFVWIFGSAATLVFIFFGHRNHRDTDA
ncbi:MAG: hypothetical protein ACI90R_000336 [Alteromonas macleodii]|jgi:hypothetical protein